MKSKSKKSIRMLLSTALCAAMVLSNASIAFAQTPEQTAQPSASAQPINLLREPGNTASYVYGEDAQYNMSNFELLGSSAGSPDTDCVKLTDGVKSQGGAIDIDKAVNFYSRPEFNTPENGGKFSAQNTVDFDLGQAKTITQVDAYSSLNLTGRFQGALGHIGKYSVYASADKAEWIELVKEKNCTESTAEETGAYVARYSVAQDKVPGYPQATGVYAQYIRIVFESNATWGNNAYLAAEEVEIMGHSGKLEGAYDLTAEPETPQVPQETEQNNIARSASYTYSDSTREHMMSEQDDSAYTADKDTTKLNDGIRGDHTGADLKNWTVFQPDYMMHPDNDANYNNKPLCVIFDLGAPKSITGVQTSSLVTQQIKQSSNLHVYVSNDQMDWFEISKKNGYDQVEPIDGVVNLSWSVAQDKIKDQPDATAVYAQYVKVVFSSFAPQDNQYVALDEIEILGSDEKMAGAYEPKKEEIAGDTDPNHPDNLAFKKPYEVLNSDPAGDSAYADPKKTKLTDGMEATKDYLDTAWSGYSAGKYREIVIDLGEVCSVSGVEFGNLYNDGVGIRMPSAVDVAFSKDKTTWATLSNSFMIPDTPSEIAKVLYSWNASEDPNINAPQGQKTVKVPARYVKLHIPMRNWCFIDEVRVFGEKGIAADAIELPADGTVQKTYMQKGPHTAGIGNLVLLYNGYYENGSGNWTAENCLPYLVHEDLKTGEIDTMFDGVLMLALRTEGGRHTFQGASSAAESATVDDFIWYLDKTLGENGDIAALNKAAQMASEKLGDPSYKMKVVLNIPGTSEKQVDFGALPGTSKSLSFSPDINPDGYMDDQVTAIKWYNQELLRRWDEGKFEHLELAGIYLVEEGIKKMTPVLQEVDSFAQANNLKYFWIPYMNAPGYSQWKRWGFDAVAYQPNYTFSSDPTTARLKNAAEAAMEYGMGIELELDGINAAGNIRPDKYNRYMDYLEAGIDYGFDGDKAYKAYYQDVCSLLNASRSTSPKIRYVYDATYDFIKGKYQKGYLQYLTKETITLNDISDIKDVLGMIDRRLDEAGSDKEYLNGQKAKLEELQAYIMAVREDITKLTASFEGVTAENITAEQKAELKQTIAKIQEYLNGQNLTSSQRSTLTRKLAELSALDPAAYQQYTIAVGKTKNGIVAADQEKAVAGTTVTLTVTPDKGYQLAEGSLKVNGSAIKGNTFVMPAENVVITAEFAPAQVPPTPNPNPAPNPNPTPNPNPNPAPAPTPNPNSDPAVQTPGNTPPTGDISHLALWVSLMAASAAILIGAGLAAKKKKKDNR